MNCKNCNKEVTKETWIQHMDRVNWTTVHVFCSKECETKWVAVHEKDLKVT